MEQQVTPTHEQIKEARGEMLQRWVTERQRKEGLPRWYIIEQLEKWMNDKEKLSIINALASMFAEQKIKDAITK